MKWRAVVAAGLGMALAAGRAGAQAAPSDTIAACRNYEDILALFDRLGYTQQAWLAGIREVPRVYLEDIPASWQQRSQQMASVAEKKKLFFRVIGPIALRVNELIAADRARAKVITGKLQVGEGVSLDDREWLSELAVRYKLLKSEDETLDSDAYAELLLRVDILPPSLTLAQAASESGWGTSRFASEGNALFGQWTWGKGSGMKPSEQRASTHGDHRVASFGSTGLAAYAYALNMNTSRAYRDFRLRRADLHRQNLRLSGFVLAETLIRYSERGQAYVEDIQRLIRQNRLDAVDDAYLRDMPVIRIVAAGNTGGAKAPGSAPKSGSTPKAP